MLLISIVGSSSMFMTSAENVLFNLHTSMGTSNQNMSLGVVLPRLASWQMADIVRHGEGTHRRSRVDTLESSDGETGPFGTNRGALKTYEQLRSLHPEKGFRNDDASIEQ